MDQASTARAIFFLNNWQNVVSAYKECNLTYRSDKMIALSRVAEEFQDQARMCTLPAYGRTAFPLSSCTGWLGITTNNGNKITFTVV